jgi:hypothetical protein
MTVQRFNIHLSIGIVKTVRVVNLKSLPIFQISFDQAGNSFSI